MSSCVAADLDATSIVVDAHTVQITIQLLDLFTDDVDDWAGVLAGDLVGPETLRLVVADIGCGDQLKRDGAGVGVDMADVVTATREAGIDKVLSFDPYSLVRLAPVRAYFCSGLCEVIS